MSTKKPKNHFSKIGAIALVGMAIGARAQTPDAVPGEFIVKTRESVQGLGALSQRFAELGLTLTQTLNTERSLHLVKMHDSRRALAKLGLQDVSELAQGLVASIARLPGIEFAEPNYIYTANLGSPSKKNPVPADPIPEDGLPEFLPNDPMFGQLWAMKNTGQKDSSGRAGRVRADIRATKAWELSTGSRDIIVAVIDTGIDYNHPDLKDNVWSMPGNPSVHGYNAIKNTLDPMDDNGHGTHCSGTIGGTGHNGVGVVGVNHRVRIMGVKFLAANGSGAVDAAIKGIEFAIENGAQVLSNSWGGSGYSKALEDTIKKAATKGILFVAAAGNGDSFGNGVDNDRTASYPANYAVENVLSIASSNNLDQMSSFSNYGAKTVHLMAPGENILSTLPGNKYGSYSGTSMATPHVSGAAALLLAREPNLKAIDLKARLLSSVQKIKEYQGRVVSGGRLDLYKLLSR